MLGDGRYQLAGGGVPPEPGLQFGFGILGPLGHAGLEEEGFQVVDAVPHVLGQRHVLGTFFHIGFFTLGKVLQEPNHTPEPPLGNPAQTHRRAAVSVLYPTFVECPEGGDLVGRVLFYRVLGRRYRRSLVELGGAGLVREVLQHRALRTLQEFQSGADHPMLEFGVIGLAHWIAVGEGHEQRPGWFDLFRMLFN